MDQEAAAIRFANWEQIIVTANSSGLKKREWCAQNGISEKAFYYWQRKVRKKTIETMKVLKRANGSMPEPMGTMDAAVISQPQSGFVELSFSDERNTVSPGMAELPGNCTELMVQIDNCQLFINGNIQERTLATVLKVIRNVKEQQRL